MRNVHKTLLLSSSLLVQAFLVAIPAGGAAAQQAPQGTTPPPRAAAGAGEEVSLDTITVTATKTKESVINTLAGASVVTRKTIERQQPGNIGDLLQDVPGVTAQESRNDPQQSINIRGMQDFGRVNVLVDGARQDYQISGHNANGSFYLEPEFLGQADVVRGPVSNIYGSGAIGGVVAFRTRSIDDILNPDEKYGAVQRVIGGTNGAGIVNSSAAGARIGTAADVFGQFVFRDTSAYRDGLGDKIADTGSTLTGGLFKANVRPADGQQISASALVQNYQFTNNGTSTGGARFKNDVDTGNYTLGYTFSRPDVPLLDLDAKGYYTTTQNQQTFVAPDADGVYPALGVVAGNKLTDKIDTYGFDIHNTARFSGFGIDHALTFGGDAVWDRVHTTDHAGGYIAALTPSGDRQLSGAFVQDELRYAGWLRVLGAVRYDQYSLSGGGTSSSGDHVSPKLTVGITPVRGIELYGTYAEGYRAPSITETLISGAHPFPAFNILPNPFLRPEIAHDLEAGVNLKYDDVIRPGDSFRAKATVFTNTVDNFIDLESVGAPYLVPFIPGAPVSLCTVAPFLCFPINSFQYVNIAKARITGIEGEGAYDWRRGFISISGTANNGKNVETGLALVSVPPYRISSTLGMRFFDEALTISSRVTFVGTSSNALLAAGSTTIGPTKGYALVDLFASYAYNDQVSANLSVNNLFNRQYTQYLDIEPSPGLTARLGVTVKFASK